LLRTGYIEAVACEGRGLATAVLRALASVLADYKVATLSPSEAGFQARLGWQSWRGPWLVRCETGDDVCEDEEVMILALPRTPPLDPGVPLSIKHRGADIWKATS